MKNIKTIQLLRELVRHLEYYNMLAPFPIYGTEYISDIKLKINKMEKSKKDYDELPVVACKYCNSLHIQIDNVENNICMRCGSVNEIALYNNIDDYLEQTKKDE